MKYEVVTLAEKKIMGLSTRTGNDDPKMQEEIGKLWQQFYTPDIQEKYKSKKSAYSIGLYSDYGENQYDVTVGFEVEKQDADDLTLKVVPAGKYAKFHITGDVKDAVAQAWGEIWNMELNRTFTGDFEEYIGGDMQNCEINIYIAIA